MGECQSPNNLNDNIAGQFNTELGSFFAFNDLKNFIEAFAVDIFHGKKDIGLAREPAKEVDEYSSFTKLCGISRVTTSFYAVMNRQNAARLRRRKYAVARRTFFCTEVRQ